MGHPKGAEEHSPMRKPGIPPARIPEITESSLHGITVTLTLWNKHRQRRIATKWWENYRSETEEWNMIYGEKDGAATALRAPSESAQYCFSNHHIASKFVSSTTMLVLLQCIFVVWEIVLIISAWWYLCIEFFWWCAGSPGCMVKLQYGWDPKH